MEYRKIQKIGGSSYSITLPKEWIQRNNLREGSTVFIEITEFNDLLVKARREVESIENEYVIDYREGYGFDYLLRKIISIYLSGVNRIIIRSSSIFSDEVRRAVEKSKELLIGIEVIEESTNEIILQDLSKIEELPMQKMISRLLFMGESMVRDAGKSIMENDNLLARDVIGRDLQIDRIYHLIAKQFYLALKFPDILSHIDLDILKAFNIRTIAKNVERICDHAEKIASLVIEENGLIMEEDIKEKINELFSETVQIFSNASRAYMKVDEYLANSTISRVNRMCDDITEWMKEIRIKNTYYIFRIAEDLTRIARYSSDICETTINEITMRGKFI
ncbi:MAG: PhoU domain-containing protein [Thermoplasmata archaeon]|jgi:phosphate uptake regulator|nr:phosphate uptake regulator PhoU [Euryarchaeota archaeon]